MKTLVVRLNSDFKFNIVSSCLVHETRIVQQVSSFLEMVLELATPNFMSFPMVFFFFLAIVDRFRNL